MITSGAAWRKQIAPFEFPSRGGGTRSGQGGKAERGLRNALMGFFSIVAGHRDEPVLPPMTSLRLRPAAGTESPAIESHPFFTPQFRIFGKPCQSVGETCMLGDMDAFGFTR